MFLSSLIQQNGTQMRNLCQISCKKRKICATVLILCLICGLTPTAESISVKLRGKIALAGILSGLAYATHVLVKRDRRAMEKLQLHLGPPDRVVQFERGFDLWRINYYTEQCYLFRNNRFIEKKVLKASLSSYDASPNSVEQFRLKGGSLEERKEGWEPGRKKYASNLPIFRSSNLSPFLIDTPVSGNPKWLPLSLLPPQQVPQFVSSDLHRLEDGHLLDPLPWLSR